jgi:hypothetical protein
LTVEEPGQTQMELVDLVKPCNDAAVDHVGKWSLGATHWKQCGRRRQAQTDICFFLTDKFQHLIWRPVTSN